MPLPSPENFAELGAFFRDEDRSAPRMQRVMRPEKLGQFLRDVRPLLAHRRSESDCLVFRTNVSYTYLSIDNNLLKRTP